MSVPLRRKGSLRGQGRKKALAASPTAASPPPLTVAGDQARQKRRAAEARQQAINEWHRLDIPSLEAAWKDRSRPISELMPALLTSLNLDQRLAESQILQFWDRVMDRTITAHARPVGLRHGTLFITVDSNPWLSELVRYHYEDMLEKLQLSVGPDKVKRLSMRVG